MKFEELRNVQVTGLDTLAGEFEAMLRQWNFSSELTGDVITPLQGSGWRGFAAETAAENIAKIRNEIDAAFEEASGIAQTLRDAHTEITAAKADLEAAIRSATDQKLTVDDDGTVHWPPATTPEEKKDPDYAGAYRQKATDAADAIARALSRAAEADAAAAAALAADTGTDRKAFNKKPVGGVSEQEAKQAVDLMRLGDKATPAQIAQLDALLKAHSSDSRFAGLFFDSLGPDGFLTSFGAMAEYSGYYGNDATKRALTDVQANLGLTLATATDGNRQPHLSDAWQAGLRKAGASQYQLLPDQLQGGNPYGYQILSNILRTGTYDPRFLNPVVEHITQLSAANPSRWEDAVSKANPLEQVLVLGKDGSGLNPMAGALEALGHRPEAATAYFHDLATTYNEDGTVKATGQPNTYLKQLTDPGLNSVLQDFEPDHLTPHYRAAPHDATALGHALEAATTGRAYDATDGPMPTHSREMSAVMKDVVDRFGNTDGPGLLKKDGIFATMDPSFGHMVASYMGDVQIAVDHNNHSMPTNGNPAGLDQGATQKLLGVLGRNPDAFGTIAQAQQAYTTAHLQDVMLQRDKYGELFGEAITNAARPGGEVAGILNAVATDEVYNQKLQEMIDYNNSVDEKVGWAKQVWTATAGKAMEGIPGADKLLTLPTDKIFENIAQGYHINKYPSDAAADCFNSGRNAASDAAEAAIRETAKGKGIDPTYLNALANTAANGAKQGLSDGSILTKAINA
ncbi:hypothetical protein AB0C76_22380 [Kitasatospora sp. NPDC048722]|uniref:hypothetical protein n=1 Tax=Kitasatospora sp. NPDC048722 TaxID=3155639 RepID=UPI0033E1F862